LGVVVVGGSRLFFSYAINPEYTKYQAFIEMQLRFEPAKAATRDLAEEEIAAPTIGADDLDAIRRRGVLRVGFFPDSLPFAFRNNSGDLVGFDMEMAHLLAKDLQVNLEFIRLPDRAKVASYLNHQVCDILMTGSVLRPDLSEEVALSRSYMDVTVAFIVKDHNREIFKTWKNIRKRKNLKIGISATSEYFHSAAERALPQATWVPLASPREFFKEQAEELDALLFLAEAGSSWTLIYPAYTVVVPQPHPITIPVVYPMSNKDQKLLDFMNAWLELKKRDGTIGTVFEHWILGKGATKKTPRWSIIRDVLHWVD
jgi:ABC-type amino acid transport substrate-binding protein